MNHHPHAKKIEQYGRLLRCWADYYDLDGWEVHDMLRQAIGATYNARAQAIDPRARYAWLSTVTDNIYRGYYHKHGPNPARHGWAKRFMAAMSNRG